MSPKKPESEMMAKRERLVRVALDVFLRYGHARTTMADIAREAGISRPALYLMFPGKDEIFAAAVDRLISEELEDYRKAVARLRSLPSKIHYCCGRWAGKGYDLAQAHPDSRDVFNMAFPPVREMYRRLESFLADLLRDTVARSGSKASPEELATLMVFGVRGLKDTARDALHMRRLIALQIDVVLDSIQGHRQDREQSV